jgi:hypothetical protein
MSIIHNVAGRKIPLDFALVPEMLLASDLNNVVIRRTNLEQITAL